MAEKQHSKVTADLKKNRLMITIGSTATKAELNKIYTDIRFCVADLKPGFDVVTDLTRCTIGHLSAIATFKKIMDYLVTNRVGRVVRIMGGANVVFRQLFGVASRFCSYKPIYVSSLDEAEAALRQAADPESLWFQIHQRQVEYTIATNRVRADLIEISTGGCTVRAESAPLSVDQILPLIVSLYQDQERLASFSLEAKVVVVEADRFTVEFLAFDQERREALYQCLVNEVRRDLG
jgi:hypothetical protein